jgi:hypothetical protein
MNKKNDFNMIKCTTDCLFNYYTFCFLSGKKATHFTGLLTQFQLHKIQLFFLFKDLELSLTGPQEVLTNIHNYAKLIKKTFEKPVVKNEQIVKCG